MRRAVIAAALAVLVLLVRGQATTAAPGCRRIISLIPSVTDLIVALGAGNRLIARTDYDHNPSVTNLPSVGGTLDPSVERIVALRPDCVFVWPSPILRAAAAQLASASVRVELAGTETFKDLWATIAQLGQLLRVERQADSLHRAIEDSLAAVRSSVAWSQPMRVLYLISTNPVITAGHNTFIDDLITAAGGRNIFGDARVRWPVVSLEAVLQRAPDVIVWPRPRGSGDGLVTLRHLGGWSQLEAVRTGRVLIVDPDLFSRPGPRVGVAARLLARGFRRLDTLSLGSCGARGMHVN